MSFTINAHMCGGDIKDIAVFQKATPCKKEITKPSCHQTEDDGMAEENDCCNEKSFETEAQDKPVNAVKIQKLNPQFVLLYSFLFHDSTITSESEVIKTNPFDLSPPYKPSDIHILVQSFLI
jgi:hypothetical protein